MLVALRQSARRSRTPESVVGGLQMAARSLASDPGLSAAAVSAVRDGTFCQTLAAAGPEGIEQVLVGSRFPLSVYTHDIDQAETIGSMRFLSPCLSHIGLLHRAASGVWGAAPPTAVLYAPVDNANGDLVFVISVTVIDEHPSKSTLALLDEVVKIARTAVDRAPEPDNLWQSAVRRVGRATAPAREPGRLIGQHDADEEGLPDRTALVANLARRLPGLHRDRSTAAVIHVSVDQLAAVSTRFGAAMAAELVGQIANRLVVAVREYDLVGQISEDSLAIIVDGIAPDETPLLVERLTRDLAKAYLLDGVLIRQRCSFGTAAVDATTTEATVAFDEALAACGATDSSASGANLLLSPPSN